MGVCVVHLLLLFKKNPLCSYLLYLEHVIITRIFGFVYTVVGFEYIFVCCGLPIEIRSVVVMIIWQLDLQLHMQSVLSPLML
jgi:hypothetical protein